MLKLVINKRMDNSTLDNKKKPGLPKGRTNNPNGRPKGAKNRVQLATKERIAKFVEEDFDNFIKELRKLDNKNKVKAKLELIKLVVPRPLTDEETDALNTQSSLFARLSQQD